MRYSQFLNILKYADQDTDILTVSSLVVIRLTGDRDFAGHILSSHSLTGMPLSCRYSFAWRMEQVRKWKMDAARAASAQPFVNPS